jgi:hypothetical protein
VQVTLIGERVNGGWGGRSEVWQRIYDDPGRYWAVMTANEAFRWAPGYESAEERCWAKLGSVLGEIKLDHTMQLLRPSRVSGAWSVDEARRAAKSLLIACPKPSLLICCGSRVTRAVYHAMRSPLTSTDAGYPMAPGVITGAGRTWFTRIPHPSGRNPQYQNSTLVEEIRDRLRINLDLLKERMHEDRAGNQRAGIAVGDAPG